MIFEQKCFENTLKPKKNHYTRPHSINVISTSKYLKTHQKKCGPRFLPPMWIFSRDE